MVLLAVDTAGSAGSAFISPKGDDRLALSQSPSQNEIHDMLDRLLHLFPSKEETLTPTNFRLVSGIDLPTPYDELLFHEEHLTGVMERRHGGASVKVLESRCITDSLYCRRILLLAPCGKAVTFAILSANLDNLPEAVRAGIREEKIPFGRFGSLCALHARENRHRLIRELVESRHRCL